MERNITNKLSLAERLIIKMKFLLIPILLLVVGNVLGQVTYSTANSNYTQNFDNLYGTVPANNTTQASTILPTGWIFTEAGTNANTTLRNDNGSSGTGDTYLDGATSSNERSFGSYASGSLTSQLGVFFKNTTGSTLTQFTLTYTGEQWKDGGSATAVLNKLSFAYAINPTSLTSGTYNNVTSLDFTALVNNTSADATTDGNASTKRTTITFTVTGISWANNQTLYLRWTDINDTGNDDNLAIDDLTFSSSSATYTVTFDSMLGTPTPSAITGIANNGTITLPTAPTKAGYVFAGWYTDNTTYTTQFTAATAVTADITIYAKWTPTYTLTYTANANGSITGTTPQTVTSGASGSAVTATPATGYHFVSWSDGVLTATRTDSSVAANVTVSATFAINTYTLTYTANANGAITGTTPQTVNYNASGTAITATPATGYHFVSWSDGVLTATRTDSSVAANVTVSATFAINTYTLTYTANANGTITGTTPQTVNYNTSGSAITATPATGYHFVSWSDASTANPRTDSSVAANISVSATFAINTYTLTYTANANGSITGTTPQTVNYNTSGTAVTAVPATGYHFVSWSDAATANPRTDSSVAADVTVSATFAINTYSVYYNGNTSDGGTAPTATTGNYGATVSLSNEGTLTKTGYNFNGWNTAANGSGTPYAAGGSFTIGLADVTLYAMWVSAALTPQTITFNTLSNKVYSTTTFNLTATASSGLAVSYSSSDTNVATVSGSTVTLVGVGTTTITASQGGNTTYDIATAVGQTLTVTPKELTIPDAASANKEYNRNNTAVLTGTLSGVINSDDVTLSLAATFNTAIVGIGKSVTSTSSLGGTKAGNYTLTQPTGLTADITAKTLTVTGATVTTKSYTGTNTATLTGASLVGVIAPDVVNITGGGTFADVNANSGIAVTAAFGLNGTEAGNYSITQPSGLTGTITTAPLTIDGLSGVNRIYDATTVATLSGTPAYVGLQNGETFTVTGTLSASFATKGIGTAKPITVSGYLAPSANYSISQPTGLSGNITVATLTVTGATANDKEYNRLTTTTTSGGSFVGVLLTDSVTLTQGTANFATATVGTGIAVTAAITATGTDGANYTVTQPALTANITAKPLTVTGATVTPKSYNGTTAATITGASVAAGVISPDVVGVTGGGTFAQASIGTGIGVTASFNLNGTDAGNYSITQPTGLIGNITAANLTITGLTGVDKVYDSTTTAQISGTPSLSGIIGVEDVSLSGVATATFATATVGTGKPITVLGYSLTGTNAGNYSLTQPTLSASITIASQTITFGTLASKYSNDAPFALTATASSGLAITYSSSNTAVATVSGSTITIVGIGTTTITASQAGNTNFSPATNVLQTLTVTAAPFTQGSLVIARVGAIGTSTLTSAGTAVFLSEYKTDGTAGITVALPTTTAGAINRIVESGTATSEAQLSLSTDGQYLTLGGYDGTTGTTSVNAATVNRVIARVDNAGNIATTPIGLVHTSGFRSVASIDGSRFWTAGNGTGIATIPFAGSTTTVVAPTVVSSSATNLRTVSIYGNQLYYSTGSTAITGVGIIQVGTGIPTTLTTVASTNNKMSGGDPYAYYMVNRGGTNWNCYVAYATGTGIYKWSSSDDRVTWTAKGSVSTTTGAYGVVAQVNGSNVDVYATTASSIVKLSDTASYNATISGTVSTIVTAPTNTFFRGISFAPVLITPSISNSVLTASGTVYAAFTNYTITAANSPASFNATGLPAGLSINTTTGVISGTPTAVGTFTVTISATNASGTDSKTLTITIAQANQVITFGTLATKDIATTTSFDLTATTTATGLSIYYTSSNPLVATIIGSTVNLVGSGQTTITAHQDGNANYNAATNVSQTLNVIDSSKSDQTITFNTLSNVVYGDAPFDLIATTTATGLSITYTSSNPSVATVSGATVTIIGIGTTTITALQSGNTSYNPATNVTQDLTVGTKQLTVINAVVTTKPYDGTTTATITGATLSGIVGSSDVVTVTGNGTFSDANAATGIVVTSNFALGGTNASNYTIIQPSLTGTIVPANQTITFSSLGTKSTLEPDFIPSTFSATAATNAISYSSSNTAVATIVAGAVHIVGVGTTTITASQASSLNYNATTTDQVLTIANGLYLNQFTGASNCPTNGNVPVVYANTSAQPLTRTTITCNSTANVFNSTTLNNTATISNTSYIEFSVTANSGYVMNLDSVSFFRQASASAPNQLEVRYSTDNFATYTSWGAAPLSPAVGDVIKWNLSSLVTPIGGTVTFRLYPYGTQRVDLTTSAVASATGTFRVDDVTIFGTVEPTPTTIWDGSVWSNGTPNLSKNAVIDAYYSTTDYGVFTANSLTVNTGYTITVNSSHTLTVTNEIINNGTFIVENNANIIQTNNVTNTGSITVKRNASMRRLEYTYWSAPVANQNLLAFSPLTLANRFYTFDEPTNAFVAVASPSTTTFGSSASQIAGKGFMIRAPNTFLDAPAAAQTFNGSYTGVPNNGTYTTAVSNSGTNHGYNLLGNPYPSPIDADKFLAANPGNLYFWTHAIIGSGANNYATYTTAGATAASANGVSCNGTIQTGQGFLLLTTTNGNATFTNAMRVGNNAGQFFRTATTEKHRIWLNLNSATTAFNQIMVGYIEGATQGVDTSIDGSLLAYGSSSLSSRIDNADYVIQGRALPFATADTVPLGFNATAAGEFTISIDHVDGLFLGSQDIYLRDNLLGTTYNIKASPYTFTSASGAFNNRFEIVYTSSPLGTHNPTFDADSVVVYKQEQVLNVNSGTTVMSKVRVFDVRGRLLFEKNNINATAVKLTDLKAAQQVVLVQITSDDNLIVTKKVVY
jgi:uncharacterized repeat protein (TIGR02543 family)